MDNNKYSFEGYLDTGNFANHNGSPIIFINSKRNIQFDFSEDYLYMHLYCRISDSQLNSIVESRGLYLDPRVKRVIMFDYDNDELNIYYFDKNA